MAIPDYATRSLRLGVQSKGGFIRKATMTEKPKRNAEPIQALHAVPPRGPDWTAAFTMPTEPANKDRLRTLCPPETQHFDITQICLMFKTSEVEKVSESGED